MKLVRSFCRSPTETTGKFCFLPIIIGNLILFCNLQNRERLFFTKKLVFLIAQLSPSCIPFGE